MPRMDTTSTPTPEARQASTLDDARWAAVVARDAAFDGQFFIG